MRGALLLCSILAQAASADSTDPAQLERIREALQRSPAIELDRVISRDTRPVFRLTVHGRTFDSSPWGNWTAVPSYIRPSYPLYHYEFLMQATPQEFRAGTLYPGVDLMSVLMAAVKGIEAERRRHREEQARKEVQDALAQLLACRAKNP